MGYSRYFGRLVAAVRGARSVHAGRISTQQRVALATFLIALAFGGSARAQDIEFDPAITQEEFRTFSELVSQGIFATPVEPARAGSLLDFEVGIAATALPIDEEASYWLRSTPAGESELVQSGHVLVPRLVATKGLSFIGISASYAQIPGTDIKMMGANLDFPILKGNVAAPSINIRGTYTTLEGIDEFQLQNYGAEVFISKGFGPLTPYAAAGIVRTNAEGEVRDGDDEVVMHLEDEFQNERYTVGLRISLLVPKVILEATQGEERSYAAKISLGF